MADTGDILLFRGGRAACSITRTVTNSHFDHVAMILRLDCDPDEVYYVESTCTYGVQIAAWSQLRDHIGKDKFIEKIVFRHVNFNRGDAMVNKLEIFLNEVIGNKYSLAPEKLT